MKLKRKLLVAAMGAKEIACGKPQTSNVPWALPARHGSGLQKDKRTTIKTAFPTPRLRSGIVFAYLATYVALPGAFADGLTNANYSGSFQINNGAGVSMWTGGAPGNITGSTFLGLSWDASGGIGGITQGLVGDLYGFELKGSTDGTAGFDFGYNLSAGVVTGTAPFAAQLHIPNAVRPGNTITIRSSVDLSGLNFQTQSPNIGARAGIRFDAAADFSTRACLVDCASFGAKLIDANITQELIAINYDANQTGAAAFDQKFVLLRDSALELDMTRTVLTKLQTPIPLYKNPLNGASIVSLRYGGPGQTTLLPSIQATGSYAAGSAKTTAVARADVLSLEVDVTQLASQLTGLPPLAASLKELLTNVNNQDLYANLPAVAKTFVDKVKYELIRVAAGLGLGVQQEFSLETPDLLIDLKIDQTNEVHTFKAGEDFTFTLPDSLLAFDNITFTPTFRFDSARFTNETALNLSPYVDVSGLTLSAPGFRLGPAIDTEWRLPLDLFNIFTDEFDVNFTGTQLGSGISAAVDRSRDTIHLTGTGPGKISRQAGTIVNKLLQLGDGVTLRLLEDTTLVNSSVAGVVGTVIDLENGRSTLILRSGSQIATRDTRIRAGNRILAMDGQIGTFDAVTDVQNAGLIDVGNGIDVSQLTIDRANVLPNTHVLGPQQGRVRVFDKGTLNLSNVGQFTNPLDVAAGGVVHVRNRLGKTVFDGDAVFTDPLYAGASILNRGRIFVDQGTVGIDTGLLQTPGGGLHVNSTLELRSAISGGFVTLEPGATLKLYDGSVLDAAVLAGTQADVFVMGNALIKNNAGQDNPLLGTSAARDIVLSTDRTRFGEAGAPGVSATPRLSLERSLVSIKNGRLFNAPGATIDLDHSTILLSAIVNQANSDAGTIDNHGIMTTHRDSSITRRDSVTGVSRNPALINYAGAQLNVEDGALRLAGGALNHGATSVRNASTLQLELPAATGAGATAALPGNSNFVVGVDALGNIGTLSIAPAATFNSTTGTKLVIDGGIVTNNGSILGDVLNRRGRLLAHSTAAFTGTFEQMGGGQLEVGLAALPGGLTFDQARLGGTFDIRALQAAFDGSIAGLSLTKADGEVYQAAQFSRRDGMFDNYRLPDLGGGVDPLNDFFWLPFYSDTALRFRITSLGAHQLPIITNVPNNIGVTAGSSDLRSFSASEAIMLDRLTIGNNVSGVAQLEMLDAAVLTSSTDGVLIQQTGTLIGHDRSRIRAAGDIVVDGGQLIIQGGGTVESADGTGISVTRGGTLRILGDYAVSAGGLLATIASGTVIDGALTVGGGAEGTVNVDGRNAVLDIGANTARSTFGALGGHAAVNVTNGGALFATGLGVATGRGDRATIRVGTDPGVSTGTSSVFIRPGSGLVFGAKGIAGGDDAKLIIGPRGRFEHYGPALFQSSALVTVDGGELISRGPVTFDGATVLARQGQFYGFNGDDITARGASRLELSSVDLNGGSRFVVSEQSSVVVGGYFDIGGFDPGAGTLVASGLGTLVRADADGGFTSNWGDMGNTADVLFDTGAVGAFGSLELARSAVAGTNATLRVVGADLSIAGNLLVAANGGSSTSALLQFSQGARVSMMDAANPASFVLGHASEGSARMDVLSGASFTTGSGPTAIYATGTLVVDHARSFTVGGDLLVDAGTLSINDHVSGLRSNARDPIHFVAQGGEFSDVVFSDTAAITVRNGGRVSQGGTWRTNGNVVSVESGGVLDTLTMVNRAGSVTVSGVDSAVNAKQMFIGGTMTYDNGAQGRIGSLAELSSFYGPNVWQALEVGDTQGGPAVGTFNVRGGSFVEVVGGITLGSPFLTGSKGTLDIAGPGSRLVARGEPGVNSTIGVSASGPADISLLRVADGGLLESQDVGLLVLGGRVQIDNARIAVPYLLFGNGGRIDVNDSDLDVQWIDLFGTGPVEMYFDVSGTQTRDLGGTIGGGVLHKTGSGELTLSGGGFISPGAMHVDEGTLKLLLDAPRVAANGLHVAAGAVFDLNGHPQTLGLLTGDGDVLNSHELNMQMADDSVFNGAITGTGKIRKFELGALHLGGARNTAGSVDVEAGSLVVDAGGALHVAGQLRVDNRYDEGSRVATGAVTDFDGGSITAATLLVTQGGNVTSRGAWVGSAVAAQNSVSVLASAAISDAGSRWQSRFLNIGFEGDGSVTVANGGVVATTNNLILGGTAGRSGALTIQANGTVDTGVNAFVGRALGSTGSVILQGVGATWNIGDSLYLGGDNLTAGGMASLTIGYGATVNVANKIKFWQGGSLPTLNLDGGSFSAGSLENPAGLVFNAGTFNLTGSNLVVGAGGLFGSHVEFNASRTMNVTNTVTIDSGAILELNGAAFSAGTFDNNGTVGLADSVTVVGGGSFNNGGILAGNGTLGATLVNGAAGEVRAVTGDTLTFTGTGNTNAGQVNLLGGTAAFNNGLINAPGGMISGHGALVATGGLTNNGKLETTAVTDIRGDVVNDTNGRIVVAGSTTTFYDDVVHNGAEFKVNNGAQAAFFGSYSGGGSFTGTGELVFAGNLMPGNSPALIDVEGDLTLLASSVTTMELGGLSRGSQYDAFDVGASLSLAGTLDVVLVNLGGGVFAPQAGDSFDLFAATTIQGSFGTRNFAALGPDLSWNIAYLTDAVGTTDVVRLSVTAVPEPQTWMMLLAGMGLMGCVAMRRRP